MDDLESGIVKDIGFEELVAGLCYRPESLRDFDNQRTETANWEQRTENHSL